MKNPADLPHQQLVEIVTRLVQIFYGTEGPDGHWTYAAGRRLRERHAPPGEYQDHSFHNGDTIP